MSRRTLFNAAACILLLLFSACKWSEEDVARTTDPAVLKQIFTEAEDADVQLAALSKIEDQAFLLAVANGDMPSATLAHRKDALNRLASDNLGHFLTEADFAVETSEDVTSLGSSPRIAELAADAKLSLSTEEFRSLMDTMSEAHAREVVLQLFSRPEMARIALDRLRSDASLIWLMEQTDWERSSNVSIRPMREEVFRRIGDQEYLASSAISSLPEYQPDHIVEMLTDQAAIARIAIATEWHDDRLRAIAEPLLERLDDQSLVADILIENGDMWPHLLERITDSAELARVAHRGYPYDLAREAVEKIDEAEALVNLYLTAHQQDISFQAQNRLRAFPQSEQDAALKKWAPWHSAEAAAAIKDPVLLTDLLNGPRHFQGVFRAVINNPYLSRDALFAYASNAIRPRNARIAAYERLNEDALYAYAAVNDQDRTLRIWAAEKLTDQFELGRVFRNEGFDVKPGGAGGTTKQPFDNAEVRAIALAKITDQQILADAVVDPNLDPAIRFAAVPRIEDQSVLYELARAETAIDRQIAVSGIRNDEFLLQHLQFEPSASVRSTIVASISGIETLRIVARNSFYRSERALAVERLRVDFDQDVEEVVTYLGELKARARRLADGQDTADLADLALSAPYDDIRIGAARGLRDINGLTDVATQSTYQPVLKIVFAKLTDKTLLARLAENALEPAMRLASAQKSGVTTWSAIFADASAPNALPEDIGHALAATLLFDNPPPEVVKGAENAALTLIRTGDEARIPEMGDLLNAYGHKTLAEDYLNAGQPDLERIAGDWARSRGYNVSIGSGSARARWGSR